MSITVRDVLKIKEWQQCRVIAGEAGLDREIQYVDSMEVPNIIPWLRKNEFLVTTAYAIKDSEEMLLKIIQALAKQQSAGIALKTKFLGGITESIKKEAENLQLPIIELPGDIPFIDIIEPLMKIIVDDQNQKLEFNKAINEKFLAVQIDGGGFREIVQSLGELLKCKVVVADDRHNVISFFPEDLQETNDYIERGKFDELAVSSRLRQCMSDGKKDQPMVKIMDEEIWFHQIYVKTKCEGGLYVIGRPGQFNELSEIAMGQAKVHLALEFSKKGINEQKEYHQDNNFFLDLIGNNILTEEDAKRRAKGLHWPSVPHFMVVSDIDGFEEIIRGKDEDEIQSIKDEVIQIHRDIFQQHNIRIFIGNRSDSFHCLIFGNMGRAELKRSLEMIHEKVLATLGFTISTGISKEINGYLGFESCYRKIRTAIIVCKKKGRMKICFTDEMNLEEAFYEMAKMPIFQKFVRDTLYVIKEYDRNRGSFLLETLRVLTENMGARKETADILYLHRNTLAYRIRQIEQLTGMDLNDPQVLFQLQLAIKIETYVD
ncbi:PucR family transcriptional regulator ligand-binding domain-containing protein [Roseburia hominis]